MSLDEAIVDGTLNPDGTLELDQTPNVAPGRVQVIVKRLPPLPSGQRGLVDVIDEIRRGQQARDFQGRSAQEIEAGLQEDEDEYEQKMQALQTQIKPGSLAGGS